MKTCFHWERIQVGRCLICCCLAHKLPVEQTVAVINNHTHTRTHTHYTHTHTLRKVGHAKWLPVSWQNFWAGRKQCAGKHTCTLTRKHTHYTLYTIHTVNTHLSLLTHTLAHSHAFQLIYTQPQIEFYAQQKNNNKLVSLQSNSPDCKIPWTNFEIFDEVMGFENPSGVLK